jgi:hypothetical protein
MKNLLWFRKYFFVILFCMKKCFWKWIDYLTIYLIKWIDYLTIYLIKWIDYLTIYFILWIRIGSTNVLRIFFYCFMLYWVLFLWCFCFIFRYIGCLFLDILDVYFYTVELFAWLERVTMQVAWLYFYGGRHGRDSMVVRFTTTYAISAYHH